MKKWIFPMTMLVIFEGISDIIAKEYSLRGTLFIGVLAITGYVIGNIIWLIALRNGAELSEGAVIFSVATAIFAMLVGILYFKEPVHIHQLIGMVIGILAITLIVW